MIADINIIEEMEYAEVEVNGRLFYAFQYLFTNLFPVSFFSMYVSPSLSTYLSMCLPVCLSVSLSISHTTQAHTPQVTSAFELACMVSP